MGNAVEVDVVRPRAGGSVRLVVVADTHGHPHPAALGHVAALTPDAILHAGDIGGGGVLEALSRIAPVLAIRGNIDPRGLPDERVIDLGGGGLTLLMVHAGVNGPRLLREVGRRAREVGAGLVVCGHSHVPFIGRDGDLAVFNPGSIGPRRFRLPIVFGLLDLRPDGLDLGHVDAETGATWAPPPARGA